MRGALEAVCLILLTACASAPPPEQAATSAAPEATGPDEAVLLAEGDADLERAFRAASKLERDRSVPPEQKIRAWEAVVALAGEKRIGELAAERVQEWTVLIEMERRRPETLRLLRETYDKHVAEVRSGAMTLQAFCKGYRPHTKDLLELGVDPPYGSMCKNRPPLSSGLVPNLDDLQ